MTHGRETLNIMDNVTTKYGQKKYFTISRTLSLFILLLFVSCLVATGLLVYSFTSTCKENRTTTEPAKTSSVQCENSGKKHKDTTDKPNYYKTSTAASVAPTSDSKKKTETKLDLRLPQSIDPRSYQIYLIPFLQEGNFTFSGNVTILVTALQNCNNITLHADTLDIIKVSVRDTNNRSIALRDYRLLSDQQFLVIEFDESLEATIQYYVHITFKGILNDLLEGFYRSSYVENNETKWIAATQFEATDARKAFPCFDEPAFKAKFQINIARPADMTVISNMPKANQTDNVDGLPDYVWDHFQESLPMSTYLVAFVVSDFQKSSSDLVSIWARQSAMSQVHYGLRIGPTILKYYEQFFGIKYPLPKLDMVAIPDFSAGAMENWGLITYREGVLLHEKGVSSIFRIHRIAHVIAHELAHQWFGNLVTPKWWTDLWLNEGFATYVEYLGAHAVAPKWKDPDLFVVRELQNSLSLDALRSSHPISVTIKNPDDVGNIFDEISYSKGASIIRMMQYFLTPQVFHKGLNNYLKSHMYGNAEQDDLWKALTEEAHANGILDEDVTVKEIMDTWTLQTGFPLVNAKRLNNSVLVSQERFLLHKDGKPDKSLWWIPITSTDISGNIQMNWLKRTERTTLQNVTVQDDSWFLINVNQTGYYRVNYDLTNWELLIKRLRHNGFRVFDPKNRAQLIDDSFNLALAGYLPYYVPLNISLYLINEREYVPWSAALGNLQFLQDIFERTGHFDKFKAYMISLIQDFYNELNFMDDSKQDPLAVMNKVEIMERACKLGVRDCVIRAVQQFQNWKNSARPDRENPINPEYREAIYCAAISDGGEEEWNFAWQRYMNTNVAIEKEVILSALGCSREVWILARYLDWSVKEDSGIRKHDADRVFSAVANNVVGRDLAYSFLKNNWMRIREYLGPSSMSLSGMFRSAVDMFSTKEELMDLTRFRDSIKNTLGIVERTAQQSIEQVEANVKWREQNFDNILVWLSSRGY